MRPLLDRRSNRRDRGRRGGDLDPQRVFELRDGEQNRRAVREADKHWLRQKVGHNPEAEDPEKQEHASDRKREPACNGDANRDLGFRAMHRARKVRRRLALHRRAHKQSNDRHRTNRLMRARAEQKVHDDRHKRCVQPEHRRQARKRRVRQPLRHIEHSASEPCGEISRNVPQSVLGDPSERGHE
eukprot:Amastigsp_a509585_14.p7 type:complete len:185 gc:universal Amastigsp_a509585_14:1325-1879(+)